MHSVTYSQQTGTCRCCYSNDVVIVRGEKVLSRMLFWDILHFATRELRMVVFYSAWSQELQFICRLRIILNLIRQTTVHVFFAELVRQNDGRSSTSAVTRSARTTA